MKKEVIINWLKFCDVKGLGGKRIIKLLNILHNAESMLYASNEDLLATCVFNNEMIQSWNELKDKSSEIYEQILNECEDNDIELIPLFSEEYPQSLRIFHDPPLNLYLQGNKHILNTKKAAIVGSRESDEKSKEWTKAITKTLCLKNITIVSGGAKGIDYEAHKSCLEDSGNTICVLGSGFFNLYPYEHAQIFEEIKKRGLLISEYPPRFQGTRISLLQRNRIISGISNVVIQVTSSHKGGSMTQLGIALKQGIPIFIAPLELEFKPNEGIKEVITKAKLMEIRDINKVIDIINKPTIFDNLKQSTLT